MNMPGIIVSIQSSYLSVMVIDIVGSGSAYFAIYLFANSVAEVESLSSVFVSLFFLVS